LRYKKPDGKWSWLGLGGYQKSAAPLPGKRLPSPLLFGRVRLDISIRGFWATAIVLSGRLAPKGVGIPVLLAQIFLLSRLNLCVTPCC